MPGSKSFAIVRPYGRVIHKQILDLLNECGLVYGGYKIESGISDNECARKLKSLSTDLLLMPYHKHHDNKGILVDGVGVALKLPDNWTIPIIMPVSNYSSLASFPIRFKRLEAEHPLVHSLIHIVYERDINNQQTKNWIKAVTK